MVTLAPIHNPVHGIDVNLTFIQYDGTPEGNISLFFQLTRPNPFCCKEHGRHGVRHFSNLDMAGLSDGLLEPVIQFSLHCQVSLPVYRKQKTSLSEDLISLQDCPYLKAGISILPHGSLEDMLPANRKEFRNSGDSPQGATFLAYRHYTGTAGRDYAARGNRLLPRECRSYGLPNALEV